MARRNPDQKSQVDTQDILARLSDPAPLSAATIRAYLKRPDEAPRLRELVTNAANGATISNSDILAINRALYLLAGYRDTGTFQPLLRLLRRPMPPDLPGDWFFSHLRQIAARVFDGDTLALLAFAADRSAKAWYRDSIMEAAVILTWDGAISRDAMQHFLRSPPVLDMVNSEPVQAGEWMRMIALLGMRELAPLVHHRMTTGDFGPIVQGRPEFDLLLKRAERYPGTIKLRQDYGLDDLNVVAELSQDMTARRSPQRSENKADRARAAHNLMADLSTAPYFRPETIKACTERYDDVAPLLRSAMKKAVTAPALPPSDTLVLCRYLYIVADMRDSGSCQLVMRLLQRPARQLEQLLEWIAHDLSGMIVRVFDWNVEPLFAVVSDPAIHFRVRTAALDAVTFLTFHGMIARERTARFLSQLDVDSLTPDREFYLLQSWIFAVALLGLRELAPLVERRVNVGDFVELEDFMDEELGGGGSLERLLATAEHDPYNEFLLNEIDVTEFGVFDLPILVSRQFIAGLSSRPPPPPPPPPPRTETHLASPGDLPISNPWRNVGRNDPCPCGSGRKAKKCCLAN